MGANGNQISHRSGRILLLAAVFLVTGGCVGVAIVRTPPGTAEAYPATSASTVTTETAPTTTGPSDLTDPWMNGCGIGHRAGWNAALSSRPYEPTYPDTGGAGYREFMEGYVWGYQHGWEEGLDWLNYSSGNHAIIWCSEENRPSRHEHPPVTG